MQPSLISDSCMYRTPEITEDEDGRGRYLSKTDSKVMVQFKRIEYAF